MSWVELATLEDFTFSDRKVVEFNNTLLLIIKNNDKFYTIENNCPHSDLPLEEGLINDGKITCPFHGAKFCLRTGEVLSAPAFENITSFETILENNKIIVNINEL
ncbi:MAG: ferredoxin [Francisellaceae bacterium]|nr:ferredoxin [Francisellaceae bacterium]